MPLLPPLTTKAFPYVQIGFSFLQLLTAALCPSSLLRLNKSSSLSFSSHIPLQSSNHLSDPLLHLLSYIHTFLALAIPNWTAYSRCSLATAENRGKITSLDLLVTRLPIQLSLELAFTSVGAHCWFVFNPLLTGTLRSFSVELLSRQQVPAFAGSCSR